MAKIQQKTINAQHLLFDADFFSEPLPELFSPAYWHQKNAIIGQATGRGTTYFVQQQQFQFVLRHYRRGGLIGKILKDSYLYLGLQQSRAWQEFNLLQKMQQLNLPCPQPVAALLTKNGLTYQADIITIKIANAQDLSQLLRTDTLADKTWRTIGRTIADFHNQQIYHHDLNIHNIMLDKQNTAWLIDFDKCKIKKGQAWKVANLQRLERSFHKEQRLHNIHWSAQNWRSLISAYQAHSR